MTRAISVCVCAVLAAALVGACAAPPPATTSPATTPPTRTRTVAPTPTPGTTTPPSPTAEPPTLATITLTNTAAPTPLPAPPAASSPVSGTVELAGGRCCAGGTAGDTIAVEAAFAATSSAGTVDAMRVRTGGMCFTEGDLAAANWEPFAPTQSYPVQVVINWVGFYLTVQYRDDQGNLSPVACDDIGIEGSPPMPTGAP